MGLLSNLAKCELYFTTSQPALPSQAPSCRFSQIQNKDLWSYLGCPIAEQSHCTVGRVLRRLEALEIAIKEFACTHPLHALQLLRSTMGCCRVEFLL